eukprot:s892_g3.t1
MMASLLLVHFLLMKRGQDSGPILIPVLSDNKGNVYSLLYGKSRKMPSAALLMELMLLIHRHGCLLAPSHVKRDLNQWADSLTHPGFQVFSEDKRLSVVDAWHQFELVHHGAAFPHFERGAVPKGGDDGRLQYLKELLARGLAPDYSFRGRPLLHRACESGDLQLAELLFSCGADLHARGGEEMSLPIEVACWCGQMSVLRLLLTNGSCFGRSLHLAALAGHGEALQLLLQYGARADLRVDGVSALDLAIAAAQAPIVELLLQCQELSAAAEESLSSQVRGRFGLAGRSRRLHLPAKLGGPRGSIMDILLKQAKAARGDDSWILMEAEETA